MAATQSVSEAAAIFKEIYTHKRVLELMYQDAPLLALTPKYKDFYGDVKTLPIQLTKPQGRSRTFSNAQAQKQAASYKSFLLTRVKDYSLASIDTESILASEKDIGAFVKLGVKEINDALDSLKRSTSFSLYGSSAGTIGTVDEEPSVAATTAITLSTTEDIVKFEVGQTIEVYSSGGAQRIYDTGVTSGVVSAVNRGTGEVTINTAYTANGTIAATDLLVVAGDYNASLSGLADWIPSSDPSATAFFGVDRSVDPTRLAGVRVSSSGKAMDEALIDGARLIGREGGHPTHAFMSYDRYANLEKTLGSRVQYMTDTPKDAKISFTGIMINGPKGKPIMCLPDLDCPTNKVYMLDINTTGLHTIGEPFRILDLDGNKMLRESSADAYEVRCAMFGQYGIDNPRNNGVLTF